MATTSTPNSRAYLLAGLRTGGVRSASQPHVPQTAAPGGSFNVPRFASATHSSNPFPEEDEEVDQLADLTARDLSLHGNNFNSMQPVPMTAGVVDGGVNKFQKQQQQLLMRQIAAQRAAFGGGNLFGDQAEMQAQMMQMEMLKYQAFQQAQQAQQYQAELIAQAQRTQQAAYPSFHHTMEPMTAGPTASSFDLRGNVAAQLRARGEYRAGFSAGDNANFVPKTAAIGGKFATRTLNPNASSFIAGRFGENDDEANLGLLPSPSRTTVISGGTSLGTPTAYPTSNTSNTSTPSKSDAAVSWRRGASTMNNSVFRSSSATSQFNTRIDRSSSSTDEMSLSNKIRPQPLQLAGSPRHSVAVETSTMDDEASSGSSKGDSPISASTPSTPPSAHSSLSNEFKKQYDGLGVGRPAANGTMAGIVRQASLPTRQPKGPPSGADELGPRNFATRVRRKATGGFDAFVAAREGGDTAIEVQAY